MDRDRDRRIYDRDWDRDRERDRDRDRLGGDAYRPRRSPPRDSYGGRGGGPASADTYVPSPRGARPRSRSPPGYRRRSRSPPPRESSWRADRDRQRSPPRRYSPRRDDDRRAYRDDDRRDNRYRSPVRDSRYNRSPRRDRSRSPGFAKRGRDFSPSDRARSPPPKRERVASPPPRNRYPSPPRRGYSPPRHDRGRDDRRDRSPRRDDRYEPPSQEPRRRSPEPQTNASVSANTSRPASPPAHLSRPRLAPEANNSRPSSIRSPAYMSPARSPPRRRESPPPREPDRDRDYRPSNTTAREDSPYRNGEAAQQRAPPSGPSGNRNLSISVISPPSGPSSNSPVSAHNRYTNPILSAPSRPRGGRGGPGFGGYPPRDFSGPPPPRPRDFNRPPPRGGYSAGPSPRGGHFTSGFRGSSNSSSTTYPRSQRFDTTSSHLADLATVVPGGQKLPPRDAAAEAKIKRLEEEAERLRAQISEKQKTQRANLREWNKMSQDTDSARLRAEFAEENLALINGEESSGPAF